MDIHTQILLTITIGLTLITALTGFIIYQKLSFAKRYKQLQLQLQIMEEEKQLELHKVITETQLEERCKIANNLHDTLGAELSILKLKLSKYSFYLKNNLFIKTDSFIRDINGLDQTINSFRAVCKDLNTPTLIEKGLLVAFHEFLLKLNECGQIKTHFNSQLKESNIILNQEAKKMCYMVFLEIINNIAKHAECSKLEMQIGSDNGRNLHLLISHNGVAFTNENAQLQTAMKKGIGLGSINKRITLLNGTINYTHVDKVSSVIVSIPFYPEKEILTSGYEPNKNYKLKRLKSKSL